MKRGTLRFILVLTMATATALPARGEEASSGGGLSSIENEEYERAINDALTRSNRISNADLSLTRIKGSELKNPCAVLMSAPQSLVDGAFESSLVGQVSTQTQLVQLLNEYGFLLNGHLLPVNHALLLRTGVDGVLPNALFEMIQNESVSQNAKPKWGYSTNREMALDAIKKTLEFVSRDPNELRPLAWEFLERVKVTARMHEQRRDPSRDQTIDKQMGQLISALKQNPATRELTEKLVVDIMQIEAQRLVYVFRLELPHKDFNVLAQLTTELASLAVFDTVLSHFWHHGFSALSFYAVSVAPLLISEWLWIAVKEPQDLIFGSGFKFSKEMILRLFKRGSNFDREYLALSRRVKGGSPDITATTEMINELYQTKSFGNLALSVKQTCDVKNICDLSYNQIVYAGQVDLLELKMLDRKLQELTVSRSVAPDAMAELAFAAKAAAADGASLREQLAFRQQFSLAAQALDAQSADSIQIVDSIEQKVSLIKGAFAEIQMRPFQLKKDEQGPDAADKLELLHATIRSSLSLIEKIQIDTAAFRARVVAANGLSAEFARLTKMPSSKPEEIRRQAEKVSFALSAY